MDKKLLDILACPLTRQPLALLDGERLKALNAAIAAGGLRFGEHAQDTPLAEALITRDGKRVYRVDDGIPVLLPEEGLETAGIAGLAA
ncbi:Trm112 family protein [Lysobacter pythonis]|uniref:Trm112 family protein n=1 Tax=Solilutibacter pythonis TaxID=2483112 RepID=A0A3M2HLC3_9GAMM|nr:Trm112 family protein [Lysobacter pythonis]RMH88673.1 Trm112 family protein [Lysobacter pythonis]